MQGRIFPLERTVRSDYGLLERLALEHGYQVELIDKVTVDGEEVSSSRVREAVRQGQMEAAARMLGKLTV